MAQETQRMAITYPDEFSDPWFQAFVDFVNALDGHHFASFEDRNIFFMLGGTFAWDAGTSTLTWSADLIIISPSTGIISTLVAGSAVINEAEFLTVDLTRGPTSPVTLIDTVVGNMTPSDAPIVICVRYGDRLYFRNGATLVDGGSGAIFEGGPASTARPVDRLDQFLGNGSTTLFTLTSTPDSNCLPDVYKNGVRQHIGAALEYTRPTDSEIEFAVAPLLGQIIHVRYWV